MSSWEQQDFHFENELFLGELTKHPPKRYIEAFSSSRTT